MNERKKCVLKAVFEKGYRIYYYKPVNLEGLHYEYVEIYLSQEAQIPLMICYKSLIIDVPEEDASDEMDNKLLGHQYASIQFVRSHQKEYEDIPKAIGFNVRS